MQKRSRLCLFFSGLILACLFQATALQAREPDPPEIEYFVLLALSRDQNELQHAIDEISEYWQQGYTAMVLESLTFVRDPNHYQRLITFLRKQTGKDYGYDLNQWYEWLWSLDDRPHPDYAEFKSTLYGQIDEPFAGYFSNNRQSTIRLDEVRWGGVMQDGIPPLRQPDMISAGDASYLDDTNVIFGVEINGDVRAYPKRILAWHEMFVDRIGGESVAGVYLSLIHI